MDMNIKRDLRKIFRKHYNFANSLMLEEAAKLGIEKDSALNICEKLERVKDDPYHNFDGVDLNMDGFREALDQFVANRNKKFNYGASGKWELSETDPDLYESSIEIYYDDVKIAYLSVYDIREDYVSFSGADFERTKGISDESYKQLFNFLHSMPPGFSMPRKERIVLGLNELNSFPDGLSSAIGSYAGSLPTDDQIVWKNPVVGKCGPWIVQRDQRNTNIKICFNGVCVVSGFQAGLNREGYLSDKVFSQIFNAVKSQFPDYQMSGWEISRFRLHQLQAIGNNQEMTKQEVSRCLPVFSNEFSRENLVKIQHHLAPAKSRYDDIEKLYEAATRKSAYKLLEKGFSSSEVVKSVLEYSPMAEIVGRHGDHSKAMKCAMRIVLDAQREIEQGKSLDVGKESAASL